VDNNYLLINLKRAIIAKTPILIYKDAHHKSVKLLNLIQSEGLIQSYEFRGLYILVYIRVVAKWSRGSLIQQCLSISKPVRLRRKVSISNLLVRKILKNQGEAVLSLIHTNNGLLNIRAIKGYGGVPCVNIY
jgi:hypothetical protein